MLNDAPGDIVPELNAPLFETVSCATASLFVHVTLPPTATVTGLGAYAVVVSVDDPETIETDVPDVGVVVVGDDELHAVVTISEDRINVKMRRGELTGIMTSCTRSDGKVAARAGNGRFVRAYCINRARAGKRWVTKIARRLST